MSKSIAKLIHYFRAKKITIAFAESVTCGMIAHKLNTVKGTSEVLMGSIVCYNLAVKTGLLSVPKKMIHKHSAESAEVTRELARNLSLLISADYYGSVTGLATADAKARHPAGTVFFCVYNGKTKYLTARKLFRGTPLQIRKKAVLTMLELVAKIAD